MAAEDMLHDMGAISIFATDTQGMGRLAENIAKYTINPARADGKLLKVEAATRVPLCRKSLLR